MDDQNTEKNLEEKKVEDVNKLESEPKIVAPVIVKEEVNQAELIKQRKEKFIKLLKKDRFFTSFAILTLLSFLFALLVRIGFNFYINVFTPEIWIVLAIVSGISAILAYYNKRKLSFIPILAWLTYLSVKIRTRNLSGLRDVTTGTWTLGPDLDPFLFLRWAKEIVATGTLSAVDYMRYVPIGYKTNSELLLHPYMIAWFHKIAVNFGSESVTHSAVLYPVFFFAITVIAFYFLSREIFIDTLGNGRSSIIALASTFFFIVLPPLLPRTIAGIPEKESAAFFFMFMAFYLFLKGWKSKTKKSPYVYMILSGAFSAGMALVWGGFAFIFLTVAASIMVAFLLGQITIKKYILILIWGLSAFALMNPFTTRYSIGNLIVSVNTGVFVIALYILSAHMLIYYTKLGKPIINLNKYKIPKQLFSLIFSLLFGGILVLILQGPDFLIENLSQIYYNLVKPAQSRLIQTVAENRQPYLNEWTRSYGPVINNIPILFWTFLVGSVLLFYNSLRSFKFKDRLVLALAFMIFLFSIIFSRISANHTFNGENFISLSLYFGGTLIFLISLGYYYFVLHKKNETSILKRIDFSYIFILSFFILGIVSARGAVRLILMLVPSVSILVSYLAVVSFPNKFKENKDNLINFLQIGFSILVILALLFSGFQYYGAVNSSATNYVPSPYTNQWQLAMGWVRDNVQENAVFGHWWDYGYWVQSLGERSTVLDGGNSLSYWNHLMGRYGLTNPNEEGAVDFLYSHGVTHFLIDSTDIGKYTAFATIGSNPNLDRRSWISTFQRDGSQIVEGKNSTTFLYNGGGFSLDEDVYYDSEEGSPIFLPGLGNINAASGANIAGIGAIIVKVANDGELLQPAAIFIYNGNQFELPLRYAFYEEEFIDFESGVDSGIFLFDRVVQNQQGLTLEENGALFYLSNRTVKSQLARIYLYGEEKSFKLVHAQDDPIVKNLKSQGADIGSFVYFQGFRGPIKIWELDYPQDIELNEEFLETNYPDNLKY